MKDESGFGLRSLMDPNWYLPILMLILLIGNPLVLDSTTYIQVSILVLWYACLTASWNFVGGFAGVLPLGHAAFAGIGAYTSTVLFMTWGITPWIGMLAGGILAVLAALVIGIPTFKLHGAYYALSSIAVVEIIRIITENTQSIFGININGTMGCWSP